MWRARAIRALLFEEVGGLRRADHDDEAEERRLGEEELERSRRRARLVVGLDLVAVAVLLFTHAGEQPFLYLGPRLETVFTVAVLLIALHAGFRLGQLEKLNAVARAWREVSEREGEPPT
jgi:hypothetical protein